MRAGVSEAEGQQRDIKGVYADLHVHTSASDGTLAPKEVAAGARKAGLSCIALTDHDTVGGIDEAAAAAGKLGIEIIPGIEISTISEEDGEEIHILGYFIRCGDRSLRQWLDGIVSARRERARKMVENLRGLGYEIELSRVEELTGGEFIGRPHIARALLKKGYVSTINEAFSDQFIGKESGAYVERRKVSPRQAMDIIKRYGGVAGIAHPGCLPTGSEIEGKRVAALVNDGLRAIEVDCPKHSTGQVERYRLMAERYGLIATAGTDYHGPKMNARIRLGSYGVDEAIVRALRDAASENA